MSIRDMDSFNRNLWDWKILNGCFGKTRISPTDVDGFVERKGLFLFIEAKSPGKEPDRGQMMTIEALQRTGLFTCIIVWGRPGNPEKMRVFYPNGQEITRAANLEDFRDIVRRWYMWADAHPGRVNAA